MLREETKIDDFDESRKSELQKFIEYGKEQSKLAREEARKELERR